MILTLGLFLTSKEQKTSRLLCSPMQVPTEDGEGVNIGQPYTYESGLYLQGYTAVSSGCVFIYLFYVYPCRIMCVLCGCMYVVCVCVCGGGTVHCMCVDCVYMVCMCECVCPSWSASLASGGEWPATLHQEST